MDTINRTLASARSLHQSGQLDEAERQYRLIVAADRNHAEAHHLLGVAAFQTGRLELAEQHIARALTIITNQAAQFQANYALVLMGQGRQGEALTCLERALVAKPDLIEAHQTLGNLLARLGRLDEAGAAYRRLLTLRPDDPQALAGLAMVYRQLGKRPIALALLEKAVALQPGSADAAISLGNLLAELGWGDKALPHYQRALALDSNHVDAHSNLASLMMTQGDLGQAIDHYRQALALRPGDPNIAMSLAAALADSGDLDAALDHYRRIMERVRTFMPARWAGAFTHLAAFHMDREQAEAHHATFDCEAGPLFAEAATLGAEEVEPVLDAGKPFLLAYRMGDHRASLSHYGDTVARMMSVWRQRREPIEKASQAHPTTGTTGPRRRVAVVSAYFYRHSVGHALLKGLLGKPGGSAHDYHIFHLGLAQDDYTEWFSKSATSYQAGVRSCEEWARLIALAGCDAILYPEIGMDSQTLKLAAMRLAPVQMVWWGHPVTSGLPTVDYFISAEAFEPEGAEDHYRERLVRLPGIGCVLDSAGPLQARTVPLPTLEPGRAILLMPGAPYKYQPEHDEVWVELARRLPGALLLFFRHHQRGAISDRIRDRLSIAMTRAGLSPEQHMAWEPWQPLENLFELMTKATVYCDTVEFSGFTTAAQAAECGLPIATLEGRFMRGRLAAGLIRELGVAETIATSIPDYVATVASLVEDRGFADTVRSRMKDSFKRKCGDPRPIVAFEDWLANNSGRHGH